MQVLPKIIVIVGPTGAGKTGIALTLAQEFNGEIVSADSRTIYKEMNVGTAKPPQDINQEGRIHGSIKDLFSQAPYMVQGIPHWGFDLIPPSQGYDVAQFADFAQHTIKSILDRGKLPIVVGGSGLYIQAIVDNPSFSQVKPNSRLREELNNVTLEQLQSRLAKIDPEAYGMIDIQNPRRLIRAIEVVESTGQPWSMQQTKEVPYVDALQIGIDIERSLLYKRIDERIDKMIAEGLVNEVRILLKKYGADAPGMTGIGYRQIVEFLEGRMSLRESILELKKDTRHYAKRQLTWFKRDVRIEWISSEVDAHNLIVNFLQQ